jgi:hypothetical protein
MAGQVRDANSEKALKPTPALQKTPLKKILLDIA